jgi:hypothetical protein
MNRYFRMFLFGICISQAIATIIFLFQIPPFTDAFPFPDTTLPQRIGEGVKTHPRNVFSPLSPCSGAGGG